MPEENGDDTPLFGALPSQEPEGDSVSDAGPSTDVDEPVDDGNVQMHLAAPWRFSEFRTPALPGVTLTPAWQSYDRETAATLYHEARRSGFIVSSSFDFSAPTIEGGQ